MKRLASASLVSLLVLITVLSQGSLLPKSLTNNVAALNSTTVTPTKLEVWSPDVRSSNITSATKFPVGSEFQVRVNITNPGPISGFDVLVNYNVTDSPNILRAVQTGNELSGGLFDPDHPPSGCFVLVALNEFDQPPGRIRFAAVMVGGCTANGTGTLFTVLFHVIGVGASFIDIGRTDSVGHTVTTITGPAPNFLPIPLNFVDARFQNALGIPPVARFTYTPGFPIVGDNITFTAEQSYDPDNPSAPANGIAEYFWLFNDGSPPVQGPIQHHEFFYQGLRVVPATGNFTVLLVVWDADSSLPQRISITVNVAPGIADEASFNWAGYSVSASQGSVTDVKGSWIVPGIVGACSSVEQHASFWVGIDGLTSSTVEQTGTDSGCVNGIASYFAWYEFFPNPAKVIKSVRISPGDTIFAEVSFVSGRFNVTIADLTTGSSFSKLGKVKGAMLSSAEWIAEAPSGSLGTFPLSDFGKAGFGQDRTGVPATCYTTVDGITGKVGSFGSRIHRLTMISSGFTVKAAPSVLSPTLDSFIVQWESAGP